MTKVLMAVTATQSEDVEAAVQRSYGALLMHMQVVGMQLLDVYTRWQGIISCDYHEHLKRLASGVDQDMLALSLVHADLLQALERRVDPPAKELLVLARRASELISEAADLRPDTRSEEYVVTIWVNGTRRQVDDIICQFVDLARQMETQLGEESNPSENPPQT